MNYVTGQDLLLHREQELRDVNTNLERLTLLDPLTGVPNRRRFTTALEGAWRHALRSREPIAVLMIDIDYFKGINDLHGHAYGDECLTTIAQVLGEQLRRGGDLLARFGGEEFVVLLTETREEGAMLVAERMHSAVAELAVLNNASPFQRRLTVSVGIGACIPSMGFSPAGLVEAADQALYEAKHLGRNRICAKTLC